MSGPAPGLVAAILRAASHPWARDGPGPEDPGPGDPDPLLDVRIEPIDVPGGPLRLLRPRDPDALPFETVSPPGAAVEELHPAHWAWLWPSGTALARAIGAAPPTGSGGAGRGGGGRIAVRGRSVLELGCGLGLPALTAARAGARVLATDRSPGAVAYVAATAAREGVGLRTASCTWDAAELLVEQGPWDVVLAADVLYGQDVATQLAALLPRLVAPGGQVWLADPRRPLATEFLTDARRRWHHVHTHGSTTPGVRLHHLHSPV